MDYKEINRESYNKHAEYFSEYFKGRFNLEERKEFLKFMSLLNGKKILDLGCGDGEHAEYFKKNGLDVTCVDISEEFIKLCKKRGLKAEVMDIEDLKFGEEEFDGVWAVTSLLHVPKSKITRVIGKIHEILKGDGILYVCVKEGEGEKFIEDKHDKSTKRFFVFWKKEELLNIFNSYFSLIDFKENKVGDTIFLEYFLRKK